MFVAHGTNPSATVSRTGTVGEEFEVPADPTRTGYIFEGWYTAIEGGDKLDKKAGEKIEFSEDTPAAYYAHFKENKTDVVLHYNDGGTTADQEVSGIEDSLVSYKEISRDGYTFKGWASTEDATEADLGMQPTYPAKPADGKAVDFYAVWQADGVTLTFSAQGGAFADGKEIATVNAETDKAYDVPATPTKTGYTFAGWYTSTNGQGDKLADNPTAPTASTVYFAKWEGEKINVHLDPNGGGFSADATLSDATVDTNIMTKTGEYLDPVEYTMPVRAGYTFLGWNVEGDATQPTLLTITIPDTETTYKAVWQANDIKITYVAQDGKIDGKAGTEEVSFNGKTDDKVEFTVPKAEKEGYSFLGWTTTAGSMKTAANPTTFPTTNATYYAAFRKDMVTLKFDANGGKIGGKNSATYSDQYGYVVNYKTPTRDGYYFNGWSTSADGSAGTNMSYTYGQGDATNGTTLYAQWTYLPEDQRTEVIRIKEELEKANEEKDASAKKAAEQAAEILRLRDENGNTIVEYVEGDSTSYADYTDGDEYVDDTDTAEGEYDEDGELIDGDTYDVDEFGGSGSIDGKSSGKAGKDDGEGGIWNYFGKAPIYVTVFWILFLILACICAAMAIRYRRKYKKEQERLEELEESLNNPGDPQGQV